jgi:hypothetical protein
MACRGLKQAWMAFGLANRTSELQSMSTLLGVMV